MSTDRQASKYDERTFHEYIKNAHSRLIKSTQLPKEFDGEGYTSIQKLHEKLTEIYDKNEVLNTGDDEAIDAISSLSTPLIMQYYRFLKDCRDYHSSCDIVPTDLSHDLQMLQESIEEDDEVNKDDYPLACAHDSISQRLTRFMEMNLEVLKSRMVKYCQNYKMPDSESDSQSHNIDFFTTYVEQFTKDLLESGYNIRNDKDLLVFMIGALGSARYSNIMRETDFSKAFLDGKTFMHTKGLGDRRSYGEFIQDCHRKNINSITFNSHRDKGRVDFLKVEIEGKQYTKLSQELIEAAKEYSGNPISLYLRLIDYDSTRNPYMDLDMGKEYELQYCEIDFKAIKEKLLDNNIKIKEEEVEGLYFDENKKTYTYIDPKIKEEIDFCKSKIYLPIFCKAFGNYLPEYKGRSHDERVVKGQVNTEDSVSSNEQVHKNILQKFLGLFVDLYNMVVGWLSKIVAFFKGEKVQQGVSSTVVFSLESSTMQSPEGDVSKN